MKTPKINLSIAHHKGLCVMRLNFTKNEKLLKVLRAYKALRWSQSMNCWYLPYSAALNQELSDLLKGHAFIDYSAVSFDVIEEVPMNKHNQKTNENLKELPKESELKLNEFKNWMRSRRYSESTINTYIDALRTFLRFFPNKPIYEITNDDVICFNNEYILRNKLSASFQNQVVNSIKLFFTTIEMRCIQPELIHRPKRDRALPNVLSKEEIKLILNAPRNIKHKAMLSLIYSCGLRRSELLNLKLNDIDSNRGLVIIRQAKGRKDRVTPLSEKVLGLLRDYFMAYRPKEWLFEGQNGKGKYDERSLANVMKQAVEKSKINKPVTLHWLRHSYATHLLENGTDLRYIQELLGHSRSRTTEIYTHVSNKSLQKIVSPFDTL
ncbi:MAG: Integrase/recombinase [Bacteroidetes bacterium]|jgi:integrase/recombinase XerD|nr:Integrase/recombinase [Bacteroidota bacterium]